MVFLAIGTTIFLNVVHMLAPSITAASRRESGINFRNPVYRKIHIGSPNPHLRNYQRPVCISQPYRIIDLKHGDQTGENRHHHTKRKNPISALAYLTFTLLITKETGHPRITMPIRVSTATTVLSKNIWGYGTWSAH